MTILTQPELAWELRSAGVKVCLIARQVGKHRATIYRWLKGIRLGGLGEFVQDYKDAKKGPRRRTVRPEDSPSEGRLTPTLSGECSPSGKSTAIVVGRK